ncbi:MAG: glucose 1-dehydrogenase [Veillonellaceae bacterium]|nr:glucose 1-dehydrogenase [Veillonellaceae bacterium]
MLLSDKVALVTGASRGIGRAIMEKFAEEGAIVYANARSEGTLDDAEPSGRIIPLYFDVCDKTAVKKAVMRIQKEQKRLDVLVNNAGIMRDAYLEMVDDATLEETFATNVTAPIHIAQYAVRLMKRAGGGSIVNMASIIGQRGNAGQTAYAASKGAVIAVTKTWARELAPFGIRVNAIAPGNIDTELFHAIGEEKEKEITSQIGMGRIGSPEEIANVALFLASSMSSYVTGETIGANGGWTL